MPVNDADVRPALKAILREIRESKDEEYADDFNLGRELDSIQILQLITAVHSRFGLLFGQDTTDIALLDQFSRFNQWVYDRAERTA